MALCRGRSNLTVLSSPCITWMWFLLLHSGNLSCWHKWKNSPNLTKKGNPVPCLGDPRSHAFSQSPLRCYYVVSVWRKVRQFINAIRWTEIKWDYTEKYYHSLIHRQLKNFIWGKCIQLFLQRKCLHCKVRKGSRKHLRIWPLRSAMNTLFLSMETINEC